MSTAARPEDSGDLSSDSEFEEYMQVIVHSWSKTLAALGFSLIPLFFVLDLVTMPRHLLKQFGMYRLVSTAVVFAQYFVLHYTKPGPRSHLHGYFFTFVVGGVIAWMTHDLGGFDSSYYAGLNLVMIAVNMLLPWSVSNSVFNALLVLLMYIAINTVAAKPFHTSNLINNLFFLSSTAVIAVAINFVKHNLIKGEFAQRRLLKSARDALWGEMEIAKRIQTALLPDMKKIGGFEIAASMIPADEVGGDYYDIIVSDAGERWIAIGDVSGHGVESGLIMMMTQTSIFTTVNRTAGYKPSTVLNTVNSVIKQNITRLGTDRYMTISVIRLESHRLTFAGKHQDILIRRARKGVTEFIPSRGTWLGILDDIGDYLSDTTVPLENGDVILLYTDGVTEAADKNGVMFGERNLERALNKYGDLPPNEIVKNIILEVQGHMSEQKDDLTVVALKRTDVVSTQAS